MQLRVARLCLDCENLHVEDRCPVCGSDQYAFLSTWLPSEERRRWRKPATPPAVNESLSRRLIRRLVYLMNFEFEEVQDRREGPHTRASDRVPDFNFDGSAPTPAPRPKPAKRPLPQSHDS
jgi:hypothetical protein